MAEINETIVIGVDEAGRGPLFGKVYTSAVVLPSDEIFDKSKLKDSKKFSSKKKIKEVFEYIKENCNYYGIDSADVDEIDKYNILQATQRSMHRSIYQVITKLLETTNDSNIFKKIIIYVDGNYFNTFKYFHNDTFHIISHECVIKGDSIHKEISGASILAKVSRDKYIEDFIEENPEYDEKYGLLSNKGYAAKVHIEGIKKHGYTPYHRKSFKLKCLKN